MIIDAHTHLFPDAMAERVLQKLVENTRPFVSVFGETKPHTDATVAKPHRLPKGGGNRPLSGAAHRHLAQVFPHLE